MPLHPDEAEIRQRVAQRYRKRFRFVLHLILTLPVLAVCALLGSEGAASFSVSGFHDGKSAAAAVFFMLWMSSVFIHLAWLGFAELTERAIQREIDRQWQLASLSYDKPKRSATQLSDDGELVEVPDEDAQDIAPALSK